MMPDQRIKKVQEKKRGGGILPVYIMDTSQTFVL